MNRLKETGILCGILAACSLCGCVGGIGSLSLRLEEQAGQYASGKEEAVYYQRPSSYRMKDLIAGYTSKKGGVFVSMSVTEINKEPDGWDEKHTVVSDDCVSSGKELERLLTQAMEQAALGLELHFDRSNYLITAAELAGWMEEFEASDMVNTICLETVGISQLDNGGKRTWYLALSYEDSRKETLARRKQVQEAADAAVTEIAGRETDRRGQVKAVWDYLLKQAVYPDEGWEQDGHGFYNRADGALLEGQASGQGYARAAKLLLDGLDVENELVSESADGQEERLRFENRVKLSDAWYRMDCCFGAATKGNEDFFLWEE